MNALRLLGKATRDTWDNLVVYTLVSLLWWACVILIVPAPAATLALYRHADPRNGISTDSPTLGETLQLILARLWRGWQLALLTLPIAALLLYNMAFYGASESRLGFLTPIWFVLFLVWFAVAQVAWALYALGDPVAAAGSDDLPLVPGPLDALKQAGLAVWLRLPTAIGVMIGVYLIVAVSAVIVVPFFTFMPALVANVFNRVALRALRIPIADPHAPTPEREVEQRPARRRTWFGP